MCSSLPNLCECTFEGYSPAMVDVKFFTVFTIQMARAMTLSLLYKKKQNFVVVTGPFCVSVSEV